MTDALDPPTNPTARQLLLVAEGLFAEHGIAGVSLRQIAAEAGSSNNSAVRYHFGTKDDLLRAILGFRLADLVQRRALLRARADPDDLRARFEAHILPLLELAEAPDSSYVSFVEQLQRSGAIELFASQPQVVGSHDEFVVEMHRLLPHIPEPARTLRIRQVHALTIHVAAARERAVNRDDPREPFALHVSTVVDGFTAHLAAPASPETERLVQAGGPHRTT